jgi:predicted  nucleic acid-binding Zn-ribbon protein
MKERLLLLYKLNKIDKELQELYSLKGDIPSMIEELKNERTVLEDEISLMEEQLNEIINTELDIETENDTLSERIDKDDNLLRSGGVKSNEEYNALVREIEDAYEKIESNEKLIDSDYKGKQTALETKLTDLKTKFEEINLNLNQKQEELTELGRQTEEEEKELKAQRNEMLTHISAEDLEYYERVSNAKFGDAVAIVRKGSCLGCFSSIPPQRAIEIRTADRFFTCEACGRILIAEELING